MADYVEKYTCGTCIEYEYAGKYTKGYCKRYGTYYHHDDSCSHWEENKEATSSSSSGGCFLSTACCKYKGLDDSCNELVTLREFRDCYIRNQSYGERLIHSYYESAPAIVQAIEQRADKEQIYEFIYKEILKINSLISTNNFGDAVIEYFLMTWEVSNQVFAIDRRISKEESMV